MIRFYPEDELLSRQAAELFVDSAQRSIRENGRFSVALAGGSTPRRTYQILAESAMRGRVEWGKVHVFWGDERCVPPDHEESNEGFVRRYLLGKVPVPSDQIYPIRCEGNSEKAASRYASLLEEELGDKKTTFDFVFLGLGTDGHTASLFPYSSALEEQRLWAVSSEAPDGESQRVTLTFPVLNRSMRVVFLVTGAEKAAILKDVLQGSVKPQQLPAQLIKPTEGELIWLVDEAAGQLVGR